MTRQRIKQSYWNSFMTRMNIASAKKLIDVWRINIDDEIFIKIVKNTSLTVNHVSCVLSIEKKTFHLIWISNLFQKMNIDCVYLSQSRLIKTLVIIKNDLIKWMKTCVLFNLRAETVAKFLWKNIICRFECFESIVMNKDFENKIVTKKLLDRYKV